VRASVYFVRVRACVRACVRVCVRVCVRERAHVSLPKYLGKVYNIVHRY